MVAEREDARGTRPGTRRIEAPPSMTRLAAEALRSMILSGELRPGDRVIENRLTVRGLGLGKMHSTVELPDNPSVRGMIHAVRHLVEVTEGGGRKTEVGRVKKKSSEDRRQRRRSTKKNEDE